MKKGISAIIYIKNNRKRTTVLVISLGFFITMLYGLSFLLNVTSVSLSSTYTGSTQKMQFLLPELNQLDVDLKIFNTADSTGEERYLELHRGLNEMAKKFEAEDSIDYALPCNVMFTLIKSIIGYTNISAVFVDQESITTITDYMDAKLIRGSIPKSQGEFLIDSRLAKNQNLEIGDSLFSNAYVITGIVSCDYYFICGVNPGMYSNFGITTLSEGKEIDFSNLSNTLGFSSESITINDYNSGLQTYKKEVGDSILYSRNLISTIATVVLSLCITVVFHMYIRDRYEEWCLYHSIGYSIREIYLSALKELLITFGLSLGFAAIITTLFVFGCTLFLVEPLGLMSSPFMPGILFQIFCILVLIYGVLQLPLFLAMQRIRTIDEIKEDYM